MMESGNIQATLRYKSLQEIKFLKELDGELINKPLKTTSLISQDMYFVHRSFFFVSNISLQFPLQAPRAYLGTA